ncbi:MAG: hypothetical protein RLY86_239 [Pseudomonadota bacterium]
MADLRTDHAGETGAVWIYRGMLAVSRDAGLRAFAERHLATESEHLARMEELVPPAARSRLIPIWRVAGWVTGALPALVGPAMAYATVAAVETFVDRHYADQIARARAADPALADLLIRLQADEVHHRDEAASAAHLTGVAGAIARIWGRIVETGSELAVAAARRI